jgi:hypothetical protein
MQVMVGFAGAGSATHYLRQSATLGSAIESYSFTNNIVEVELLPSYAKGRLVFFDENQSDRWRPVTLIAGSAFPMSQFIGAPYTYAGTAAVNAAAYNGGDFPLYVPANQSLRAVFGRNASSTTYTSPVSGDAGTAKFSLKIIEMA